VCEIGKGFGVIRQPRLSGVAIRACFNEVARGFLKSTANQGRTQW
jgi:hypothetical protein